MGTTTQGTLEWTCIQDGTTTLCSLDSFDALLLPFMWLSFVIVFLGVVSLFLLRIKHGT